MTAKSLEENRPNLLDQRVALGVYLDNLLCPSLEEQKIVTPVVQTPAPAIQTKTAPVVQPVVTIAPPPPPATPLARPAWMAKPFQCVLFEVAGVTLAAPLISLNGVLVKPKEITAMPGRESWFLGLIQYHGMKVKVVDTALLVIPRHKQHHLGTQEERLGKLLLVGNHEWALACNRVNEIITLDETKIKWRAASSQHAWFFGMVIGRMCALIDTEAFVELLKRLSKGDKTLELGI